MSLALREPLPGWQEDFEKEHVLLQTSKEKLTKKVGSIEGMLATHTGSKGDAELAKKGSESNNFSSDGL